MVEYQKQKKRCAGVILRWRKSPPPNQGLTYGETSLSAKGSSPFLVTQKTQNGVSLPQGGFYKFIFINNGNGSYMKEYDKTLVKAAVALLTVIILGVALTFIILS